LTNQKDTSSLNDLKFSLAFRNNGDKIEAKLKISAAASNVADSSKTYLEESYYNLNGDLSEVWIYIDKKSYKIDRKTFSKLGSVNSNSSAYLTTCSNFTFSSYSLECYGDGNYSVSCYYTLYTVSVSICNYDNQAMLTSSTDFGGGGGTTGIAEYDFPDEIITDSLTNPCLKHTYEKLSQNNFISTTVGNMLFSV